MVVVARRRCRRRRRAAVVVVVTRCRRRRRRRFGGTVPWVGPLVGTGTGRSQDTRGYTRAVPYVRSPAST